MHSPNLPQTELKAGSSLDPGLLASCQRWIDQRWGLHYPPEKWRDLNRHLNLSARELNYDTAESLARSLLAESLSRQQEQQLVRELTVGETYFFRDRACFQTLSRTFLAPLIAQRSNQHRTLNLWSAGCCTGEEAYSLAMLIGDLLDDEDAWQINILGTDLNRAFLDKAKSGVYGAWSFRRVEPGRKQTCFHPETTTGQTRLWRIRDRWQSRVRFFELNLAEPTYPDPARGLADLDLILCRNVLMYFSPAQAIAALHRLTRCLSGDGLLLVGAVDGALCQSAGLATEVWPGALGIRPSPLVSSGTSPLLPPRDNTWVPDTNTMPISPVTQPAMTQETQVTPTNLPQPVLNRLDPARLALAEGHYQQVLDQVEQFLEQESPTLAQEAEAALLSARALANLNRPEEAEYWARQAVQLDRLQPAHYWVLANILLERKQPHTACEQLTKALYLEPDFILAHYLSGLLHHRDGKHPLAQRHLKQCLRLLDELTPDTPVPEGEGLSAAELRYLATTSMTTPEQQPEQQGANS